MALHSQNDGRINGIALCAGVGGLEIGLHIAEPRYRTVCFVEREAYSAATLVARMADQALDNAPVWDDVATFDGRPWRGRVHLVAGGYPCQPFSFAGRRQGEDDPRHLWPQVRRIVSECDPEWCFFENVEGHVNLGADAVVGDLQSMGFTVKAGLFSALETGASHYRRRLWCEILGRRPELQPELLGLADGMADRVDRAFAAGNGVVSLAAAYARRTLKAAHLADVVKGL